MRWRRVMLSAAEKVPARFWEDCAIEIRGGGGVDLAVGGGLGTLRGGGPRGCGAEQGCGEERRIVRDGGTIGISGAGAGTTGEVESYARNRNRTTPERANRGPNGGFTENDGVVNGGAEPHP